MEGLYTLYTIGKIAELIKQEFIKEVRREKEYEKQFKSLPEYQCLITEKIGQFIEMNNEILFYCLLDKYLLKENNDYVTNCFKKYDLIKLRGD